MVSFAFPFQFTDYLVKIFGTEEQKEWWNQYNPTPKFDFKNILKQVWDFIKPFLPILIVVMLVIVAFFIVKDVLIEIIKTKILEVI